MRDRFASFALAGLVAFAAACGDDDDAANPDAGAVDAGTPDAAPAPTLADICDETDGLYIEFFGTMFDCRPEFIFFFGGELPTDAELSDLCEGALGPFIDDGTVELGDADAFAACRTYVENLTCEDADFDVANPCDDVIIGTITLGNDCDSDDQCAGNAFCAGGLTAGMLGGVSTCGTCTATKTNGSTCDESSECASGYCDDGEDGAPGTCRDIGLNGDPCDESFDCLGSRVCDPSTLECKSEPTWAAGTPCQSFPFDCDGLTGDLMCHPATLECVAYLNVGETCEPNVMMAAQFCRLLDNENCLDVGGGTFECVAPQTAAVGEECGIFTGFDCGANLRCDEAVCKTIVPLSGDCTGANSICDTFLECIDGVCQYGEYTGQCPAP